MIRQWEERPRVDGAGGPSPADGGFVEDFDDEDIGNARDLPDAPLPSSSGLELIQEAFPGAEVIE